MSTYSSYFYYYWVCNYFRYYAFDSQDDEVNYRRKNELSLHREREHCQQVPDIFHSALAIIFVFGYSFYWRMTSPLQLVLSTNLTNSADIYRSSRRLSSEQRWLRAPMFRETRSSEVFV